MAAPTPIAAILDPHENADTFLWVESTAGAVAVGRAYLLLVLSVASASVS